MLIFICDLDMTVINSKNRIQEICEMTGKNEYDWGDDEFELFSDIESIKKDDIVEGAEIITQIARNSGAKLIFLTGRSERARKASRIWLQYKLNIYDSVPLLMRENNDKRLSHITKYEVFQNVVLRMYPDASFMFFDDDERLLPLYANHGVALKSPECWKALGSSFKENVEKEITEDKEKIIYHIVSKPKIEDNANSLILINDITEFIKNSKENLTFDALIKKFKKQYKGPFLDIDLIVKGMISSGMLKYDDTYINVVRL